VDENVQRSHSAAEIPNLVNAGMELKSNCMTRPDTIANVHYMLGEYDTYLKIALPLLLDEGITKGTFKRVLLSRHLFLVSIFTYPLDTVARSSQEIEVSFNVRGDCLFVISDFVASCSVRIIPLPLFSTMTCT
jgi:hypothetical protein